MRNKSCEQFVGDESVDLWDSEGCRGKGWEVGLQRGSPAVETGEVDGGCLECRQIAQRGPGKKALQPRLSAKF